MNREFDAEFEWQRCPEAAALVEDLLRTTVEAIPLAACLEQRMRDETGTRMIDWVDHLAVPDRHRSIGSLAAAGFVATAAGDEQIYRHSGGLFPTIRVAPIAVPRLTLKVDSVADFLFAHQIDATIEGRPRAPLRTARAQLAGGAELWVIERHGRAGFEVEHVSAERIGAALAHQESFLRRRRKSEHEDEGFEHARALVRAAGQDLGVDWACDLFFAAERRYWQSRNRAARIQKDRQDRLGLGWANHDHHTYRSSREHFARLIGLLGELGFQCRERFYGGAEAGWGAQVLEQPHCGVVIFADVDLSPTEVTGEFAHQGLAPRDELGTVGLWCKLHGEAMLQAGMHHLECRFAFDTARQVLAGDGIRTMAPFTDFDFLKQAFTEGETWAVDPARIDVALAAGWITHEQAKRFRQAGSIGSHLEILQRDDGYKGFNQTGISEIIRQTDPRQISS
jgi:hypothetical protein